MYEEWSATFVLLDYALAATIFSDHRSYIQMWGSDIGISHLNCHIGG